MFGALAVYGSVTKRDLTGMGRFMFMGLIGLVIASVVSIFWQNDAMQFVMGVVGVLVFSGLTAYDTQRLRAMALAAAGRAGRARTRSSGRSSLYLNFVNLFLSPAPPLRATAGLRRLSGRARRPAGCRASSRSAPGTPRAARSLPAGGPAPSSPPSPRRTGHCG